MEKIDPLTDPRHGIFLSRMARGSGYLLRGYRFVFKEHTGLLKLCIIPLIINLMVFSAAAVALYMYGGEIINWVWPRPDAVSWRVLWYVLYVFMVAIILLLGYVLFFALQGVLSAPFNDLISERVEQLAYGKSPPPFTMARFSRGIAASVLNELRKQSFYILAMGALLLVKIFIPVLGPAIFLVGGFMLSASFFCYDFMDFSMARRELPWKRKMALLRGNHFLTFGFGAILAVAMAVPILSSVSMPMAAVGGTLLFCDLERAGAVEDVI